MTPSVGVCCYRKSFRSVLLARTSTLAHPSPLGTHRCDDVRYAPNSDQIADIPELPKSANNGLVHRSKGNAYSITSSARASKAAGTSRPRALAVFRLIDNMTFVGNSTGRSPGLAPLSILSTKSGRLAAWGVCTKSGPRPGDFNWRRWGTTSG